jgi:hypothetical protein
MSLRPPSRFCVDRPAAELTVPFVAVEEFVAFPFVGDPFEGAVAVGFGLRALRFAVFGRSLFLRGALPCVGFAVVFVAVLFGVVVFGVVDGVVGFAGAVGLVGVIGAVEGVV